MAVMVASVIAVWMVVRLAVVTEEVIMMAIAMVKMCSGGCERESGVVNFDFGEGDGDNGKTSR